MADAATAASVAALSAADEGAAAAAQLAHMDLVPSRYVSHAVTGSFSAAGLQDELAIARHDVIELVRIADGQAWEVVHSEPVFGVVRGLACLPTSSPTATQPDTLVVTSDSGCLSVIRFDPLQRRFVSARPACDDGAFGKSGVRRTVPGEYLAVDPRGRAIMVAALEATKLLYPVRHVADAATGKEQVLLLSPIEVLRPFTVTFSLVALDTAPPLSAAQQSAAGGAAAASVYDAPCRFAALEADRRDAIQLGGKKQSSGGGNPPQFPAPRRVTVYEFDLALQSCVPVLTVHFDCARTGGLTPPHSIVAVPAHLPFCPQGGFIACCAAGDEQVHAVTFRPASPAEEARGVLVGYDMCDVTVPRPVELRPERDAMLVTGVAALRRLGPKRLFLALQNEAGDLFKLDYVPAPAVATTAAAATTSQPVFRVAARYFDTVPVATAAVVTRKAGLAVFGEGGASALYQIVGDGYKDESYLAAQYKVEYEATLLSSAAAAAAASSSAPGALATLPVTLQREVKSFRRHAAGSGASEGDVLRNLKRFVGSSAAMASTRTPTLQMQLLPHFQSETSRSADTQLHQHQQQGGGAAVGKRFLTVRGKGGENSAVSLLRFGHKATILATFGVSQAYDSVHVLERHGVFLVSSSRHNSTAVFDVNEFGPVPGFGHEEAACTLTAFELPDNRGIVQVHRNGFRLLTPVAAPGEAAAPAAAAAATTDPLQQRFTVANWRGPTLQMASVNAAYQMLVAVERGGLVMFELNDGAGGDGRMREVCKNDAVDGITCVGVAPPMGREGKALIGAVGRRSSEGQGGEIYFIWLVTMAQQPAAGVGGGILGPAPGAGPRALQPINSDRFRFSNAVPVSCVFTESSGTAASSKVIAVVGLDDGSIIRIPVNPNTGVTDPAHTWPEISISSSGAPARLIPTPLAHVQSGGGGGAAAADRCTVFAVAAPNTVYRLSMRDSCTYTQVPVSVYGDALAAQHCSYACPLRTARLPSALILLNDRAMTVSVVTLDTTSDFFEQVLLRPATNCTLRRVGLTRDRAIGVVLHTEARSKPHAVVQARAVKELTQHAGGDGSKSGGADGADAGRIRGRQNDAIQKDGDKPRVHVPCNDDGSSGNGGFSWYLESFNLERAVRRAEDDAVSPVGAIAGGIEFAEQQKAQRQRFLFDPAAHMSRMLGQEQPLPEAAVTMVVGKMRMPDGSTNPATVLSAAALFGDTSVAASKGIAELVVVSVVPALTSAAPLRRGATATDGGGNAQPVPAAMLPPPRLYTFALSYTGAIALAHATVVDETVTALHVMTRSRWLVAGAGRSITLYAPGRTQLLVKMEEPEAVPWRVVAMASSEDDVLCVCDAHESVFFFKLTTPAASAVGGSNLLSGGAAAASASSSSAASVSLQQRPIMIRFADDIIPRHINCCTFVDPMTVAVADKFGCISILRFTNEALAFADAMRLKIARGNAVLLAGGAGSAAVAALGDSEATRLKGAPRKVHEIAHFFIGQQVVSLDIETVSKQTGAAAAAAAADANSSASGSNGGDAVLYYATALGKVGALVPLTAEDYQHLVRVERALHADLPPLLGRDHFVYRSSFAQTEGVVDVSFIQNAWRAKKAAVEEAIENETMVAAARAESVGLPAVAARQLETGMSELLAKALGMIAEE